MPSPTSSRTSQSLFSFLKFLTPSHLSTPLNLLLSATPSLASTRLPKHFKPLLLTLSSLKSFSSLNSFKPLPFLDCTSSNLHKTTSKFQPIQPFTCMSYTLFYQFILLAIGISYFSKCHLILIFNSFNSVEAVS